MINQSLTLLGLGLIKSTTVSANFNNPRPSLTLNNYISEYTIDFCFLPKFIIEKSRGEVSLVEQDIIENDS